MPSLWSSLPSSPEWGIVADVYLVFDYLYINWIKRRFQDNFVSLISMFSISFVRLTCYRTLVSCQLRVYYSTWYLSMRDREADHKSGFDTEVKYQTARQSALSLWCTIIIRLLSDNGSLTWYMVGGEGDDHCIFPVDQACCRSIMLMWFIFRTISISAFVGVSTLLHEYDISCLSLHLAPRAATAVECQKLNAMPEIQTIWIAELWQQFSVQTYKPGSVCNAGWQCDDVPPFGRNSEACFVDHSSNRNCTRERAQRFQLKALLVGSVCGPWRPTDDDSTVGKWNSQAFR